jgi:hypothetical protein
MASVAVKQAQKTVAADANMASDVVQGKRLIKMSLHERQCRPHPLVHRDGVGSANLRLWIHAGNSILRSLISP